VSARAALGAAALLAACAASPPAPAPAPAVVADGRYAMGTILEITLVADDADAARARLDEAFAEVAELERVFTTFDPASAVMQLNARAGTGLVRVDPRLARLVADSLALARRTGGAFDPTVGPLVSLWTAAGRRGVAPTEAELAAARARVGYERVRVEGDAVALAAPGMALDFGAIAKGWVLDRVRERLATEPGVRGALLDFGSSSVIALGRPADAEAWTLALPDGRGGVAGLLRLRDRSLGVSGSLGQWSEIGGVRYGHIVDPRTGLALRRNAQAAVVAPTAAAADAWDTALVVLGADGLARLADEPGSEALVIEEGGTTRATPGWAEAVRFESGRPPFSP
jgi:thiamine biosynthesis lipoprotein